MSPLHPRPTTRNSGIAAASLSEIPFESAAAVVLGRMQEAFALLLKAAPGPTAKCTDIEKAFAIDPKLSWQVYRMATATNPLAVGTNVPARVSVQRLLKSALSRGLPANVVEQVSAAFDDFERFIQENAEDREGLEAMITAHLPEAREKTELANKQAAFKAMSQIRGIAMDAALQTYFRHPASDGQTVEMVSLEGFFGLRRVKPEARIGFSSTTVGQPETRPLTLDGSPSDGPSSTLISEFSTTPLPRIEFEVLEGATHHWIMGQDVGLRGAVNLVSAWRDQGRGRRFWHAGEPTHTGAICVIEAPMKRLTFDMFVHNDLYPGAAPELLIYQLGMHGHLRFFGDPARAADRLDMAENIRVLGTGLVGARLAHVPQYVEMLEHVHGKLGWNPAEFRGFRLDVQYPVHGAQYSVGFPLPDPPR